MSDFRPVYLDSSAVLKLVVPEAESRALWAWLHAWPDQFTSSLANVEVVRALRRRTSSATTMTRADAVMSAITTVHLDGAILKTAGQLKDPLLRSLDAIHLGAALSIGDYPEAFVTYDERLAAAARRLKMKVASPA